ncbi:MAG: sulfite exporter TauE/SafE family protein [Bacteroidia bacterium]|nr:sulfite exporter TauE/SafE family protein [Bacteroidia bacterium]
MIIWLTSAILLGIVSSLHCVGMCGPLMLALPMRALNNQSFHFFLYQFGRITMYALLGFIFGWLGETVKLQTSQQVLSIVTGIIILVVWVVPKKYNQAVWNPAYYITKVVTRFFGVGVKTTRTPNYWLLGMINGLLPCGVVYLAVMSAIALGSPIKSAAFMLTFGIGTIPALLGLAYLNQNITSLKLFSKIKINTVLPVLSILVACLLIVRGLNLGIPYLSPKLQTDMSVAQCAKSCCYKK